MNGTFELKNLVTRKDDIKKIKAGKKSAVRRSNRFGEVGDTWELDGELFVLVNVYQQKLGNVTEANAKQEGYPNLDEYINGITSIHEGSVWDPEYKVWVHEFKAKN